jgi:hypothetical protein
LVVFLLLANGALYFWMQYQSRPPFVPGGVPPDIGELRLLHEEMATRADSGSMAPAESSNPAAQIDRGDVDPPRDEAVGGDVDIPVAEQASPAADTAAPVADETSPAANTAAPVADETLPAANVDEPLPTEPLAVDSPAEPPTAAAQRQVAADSAAEDPPAPVADEPVPTPAMRCARVGPLDDNGAAQVREALPAGFAVLEERTEDIEIADGYFVMIPPLPSRAAGNEMLQRLSAAGVRDTWLFRAGANENAISLGLFSRRATAERHAANIADKGFEAEVRQRMKTEPRRFLVVEAPATLPPLDEQLELPEDARVSEAACP